MEAGNALEGGGKSFYRDKERKKEMKKNDKE